MNGKRVTIDMTITGEGDRYPRDIFMEFVHKMEVAGYKVQAIKYEVHPVEVNGMGRIKESTGA